MQLRRLLGLSGEVSSRRLRRFHSTAASSSRPAWAMMGYMGMTRLQESLEPRAMFRLTEPPRASLLLIPFHFVMPRASYGPGVHVNAKHVVVVGGSSIDEASSDGFLLLHVVAELAQAPAHATTPIFPNDPDDGNTCLRLPGVEYEMNIARVVCNPLSGQLLRLPDIGGTSKKTSRDGMAMAGFLTQADRGHGPPDRYAVAEVSGEDFVVHRFPSETGRWEEMAGFLPSLPVARPIVVDQMVVSFGGRIWWIDLGWGAVSVDPFAEGQRAARRRENHRVVARGEAALLVPARRGQRGEAALRRGVRGRAVRGQLVRARRRGRPLEAGAHGGAQPQPSLGGRKLLPAGALPADAMDGFYPSAQVRCRVPHGHGRQRQ